MNIRKKIIAAVVGLTLVALVAPGVAQGVTIEELLAQIAQLQAQLAALQAQQGGGTASVAACSGVTFSRYLTVGSTGADVKCLQAALNAQGFTVATTGAGSPGSETTYLGPLTLVAVRAYQASKGWTPANQVGPMTVAALNSYLASGVGVPGITPITPITPGITTPGVEGSITVTKSASPASGVELYTGQSNVAVAAVDVKATNSDVIVNRLDFNFTGISGTACNVRPWLNISEMVVSDGTTSKSVAVTQSNTVENTVGSSYTVRVEGLNILISKGTTKKITVSVSSSALPTGATTCTPTVQFGQNAVRATDGASVSQYGPTTALTASTFSVKTGDTGTLEVSVSADNPKARNVIVQENASTPNVELLRVNVKAKNNNVILRRVSMATLASDTLATVMPTVRLFDGSTELASTSTVTAASSTFDGLNLTIPVNTTKTLIVKGDLAKQSSTYSEGTYVYGRVAAADITGEDATTYSAVTGSGSDVDANNAYAYLKAPTFALVSKSEANIAGTSGSSSQAATFTIRFNVTANGGDVFIRNYSSTATSSGIVAQAQDSATGTVAQTFTTNATTGTNAWRVSSGETKYFETTVVITNETEFAVGYFVGAEILNVKWATTDAAADGSYNTQTWGVDDLKTSKVYIYPRG